jgi:hypothetical protein
MGHDLADKVAALEARVQALEQRVAPTARATPPAVPDSEVFWALEGLKARAPEGAVLFTGAVTLPTGETYEWQRAAPADQFLGADWAELAPPLATTVAALGHPVRLQLLGLILSGTHAVAELRQSDALGTSGQLYHHLRQLVSAGWLTPAGRGRYAVPPERIIPLLTVLAAAQR